MSYSHSLLLAVLASLAGWVTLGAQTLQLDANDILRREGVIRAAAKPATQAAAAATEVPKAAPKQAKGAAVATQVGGLTTPVNPIQIYLYAEPSQCRVEAMIDASVFERWLRPNAKARTSWTPQQRKQLESDATARVVKWLKLSTERGAVPGEVENVSMVKGKPGATLPLEEAASLAADEAWVGLSWSFNTPNLPDEIAISWTGLYPDAVEEIPVRIFHGKTSTSERLNRGLGRLTWKARGKIPKPRPLAEVPPPSLMPGFKVPVVSLLWLLVGLLSLWRKRRKESQNPRPAGSWVAGWCIGLLLTYPLMHVEFGGGLKGSQVSKPKQAEAILTPLLRNVYQAFDRREESAIYDVLALSADGELLRQLYLETVTALTLDGREGARVSIEEFTASVEEVTPQPKGWSARCQWTALGNVGHWGHNHTRINRYKASLVVQPVAGAWKITQLQVIEARRL